MRYDPDVTQEGLNALGLDDIRADEVQTMDSVEHIAKIQRVGKAYADEAVKLAHLRGFV